MLEQVATVPAPASGPIWEPVEGTLAEVLARVPDPFPALAESRVPAVILRGGFPPEQCAAVVRRLYESGQILERDGVAYNGVGTSLVNLGRDPESFFASARETQALYQHLFDGLADPVKYVYESLAALAHGHRVCTAYEPDGRRYGPGIFRIYPAGKGHPPHFDSVRLREGWSHYAAARFEHQFAGVLCLQATDIRQELGECILHRQQWTPEIQPLLMGGPFHEFAERNRIPNTRIRLEAGDFYVFNPRHIHEVPYIEGTRPRIVLAVFIGYTPSELEVFVWS
jgi:hypothetical protein